MISALACLLTVMQLILHYRYKGNKEYGVNIGSVQNGIHHLSVLSVGLLAARAVDPVPVHGIYHENDVLALSSYTVVFLFAMAMVCFYTTFKVSYKMVREDVPKIATYSSLAFVIGMFIVVTYGVIYRFYSGNYFESRGIFQIYEAVSELFLLIIFNTGYYRVKKAAEGLQTSNSSIQTGIGSGSGSGNGGRRGDSGGKGNFDLSEVDKAMRHLRRFMIIANVTCLLLAPFQLYGAKQMYDEPYPESIAEEEYKFSHTIFFWLEMFCQIVFTWYGWLPIHPESARDVEMKSKGRKSFKSSKSHGSKGSLMTDDNTNTQSV